MNAQFALLFLTVSASALAQTAPEATVSTAELIVRSEQSCTLRINGRDEGEIQANVMRNIAVKPGDLLLECDAGRGQRAEKVVKAVAGESAVALFSFGPYERYSRVTDGVLDRQERIVWASSDNGSQISWEGAKSFCAAKGERWRLPSHFEWASLWDRSNNNVRRWVDPYDQWYDRNVSITTSLIRWTTPCFFKDDGMMLCHGDIVEKRPPERFEIFGFSTDHAQNGRALCVRNDGARADAGIQIDQVTEFESRRLRLPQIGGARITSVQPDGSAAKAGLLAGDIVIGLNGTAIGNAEQLKLLIQKSEPGRTATFSVFRDGETMSVAVVLGSAGSQ